MAESMTRSNPPGERELDELLIDATRRIATAIGTEGLVARFGGEEMAVIMPNTDRDGARVVAQLILDRMQQANIPHTTSPFGHVTVSIGIATAEGAHLAQLQGLIEAADQALYDAKMSGRNRLAEQGANVFPEALAN